jgi:hypothetical protein
MTLLGVLTQLHGGGAPSAPLGASSSAVTGEIRLRQNAATRLLEDSLLWHAARHRADIRDLGDCGPSERLVGNTRDLALAGSLALVPGVGLRDFAAADGSAVRQLADRLHLSRRNAFQGRRDEPPAVLRDGDWSATAMMLRLMGFGRHRAKERTGSPIFKNGNCPHGNQIAESSFISVFVISSRLHGQICSVP